MASRESSRSCGSGLPISSRAIRGRSPRRTNTGSSRTSIRRSTTRAGARRPNGVWASSSAGRPRCSTGTASRWRRCTPDWICARTFDHVKTARRLIFVAALGPFAWLIYFAIKGDLTANPIDYITDTTGQSALWLLVFTLTVTPLRRLTGYNELIKLRRMLGLFVFFYACLHFTTWFVLDWFFDIASMASDVVDRRFITIGMATC